MPQDNLARKFIGPVNQPAPKPAEVVDLSGKNISENELTRRRQQRIQEEMAAAYWAQKSAAPTNTRMQHQPGLIL